MIVLIDYDNVSILERRRGMINLVDKILNSVGVSVISKYQRVSVKLYGGWFEGNSLSKTAQKLSAEVGVFPKAFMRRSSYSGHETLAAPYFICQL
jgi:hypothetical protein